MKEFTNIRPQNIHALFNYSPFAVAKVSAHDRFLACNQEWCKMLKYSEAELLLMTWKDITPDRNEVNRDSDNMRAVIRGDIPYYDFWKTVRAKDGTDIPVHLRAVGNHDEEGNFLFFWSFYKPEVQLDHTVFMKNSKTGKDVPDPLKIAWTWARENPRVALLLFIAVFGGQEALVQLKDFLIPMIFR